MKLNDKDLGYISGVIDSEGNVDINRLEYFRKRDNKNVFQYKASIRIGMECYNTVKKLQQMTGMGKIYQTRGKKNNEKRFYLLYFNEAETKELLPILTPELVTKQRDIQILNEYYQSDNKDALFFEMRGIKRGTDKKRAKKAS